MLECFAINFFVATLLSTRTQHTIVEEICYTKGNKTEWSTHYSIVKSNYKTQEVVIDDYEPSTNTTYVKVKK